MESNFQFLVARLSTVMGDGPAAPRSERICCGTEGSNPSPSSNESGANLTFRTLPSMTVSSAGHVSMASIRLDAREQRRPSVMPSIGLVIAGRFVQGLGGGLLSALAYVLVRNVFPEDLWPRVFGLFEGTSGSRRWCISLRG
jgi:MFS family permease